MNQQDGHGLGDGWDGFFRDEQAPARPRRAIDPHDQDTVIRDEPVAESATGFSADPEPKHASDAGAARPLRASDPENDPTDDQAEADNSAATAQAAAHDIDSTWHHPFTTSLGWTALGTVLPGLGFLKTRWRLPGLVILALFVIGLVSIGIYVATDPFAAATIAVRPRWLKALSVILLVAALVWVAIITGTHLLTRPRRLTTAQRSVGAVAVALLSFAVATPLAVAARYSYDQATLVNRVFGTNDKKKSQTRPTIDTRQKSVDVWKDKPLLNILLVGIDDSAQRQYGTMTSTDTMMVASINTANGNMVLTQVPRNMAGTPFPKGSELAEVYPNGYTTGDPDSADSMANGIWSNVPLQHPDLFANTDYPGADALKLGMEGAIGLKIDYFVALNIDGLVGLINAMGGVKINVNERIPIAGNHEGKAPTGWIEPGPNQLLNGYRAMWYARSRSGAGVTDFDRMGRQSCVIKAVVDQADPQTMLTRYEAIAKASGNAVSTDIPSDMLPHLVDLSSRVKNGKLKRVLFVHGQNGFSTRRPDFEMMKRRVAKAVADQGDGSGSQSPRPSQAPTATPSTSQSPSTAPSEASTTTSTPGAPDESSSGTPAPKPPVEDLTDACAYNPK